MAPQSALVVLVPDAERLVSALRQKYDPSAAAGMPAHVTILFPFLPPASIDDAVAAMLTRALASRQPFDAEFGALGEFPDVLYLAPQPAESFRSLTELVWTTFPQAPPYGGVHAEVVPHLTVGHFPDPEVMAGLRRRLVAELAPAPVRAAVTELVLMDNRSGRWTRRLSVQLAGRRSRRRDEL